LRPSNADRELFLRIRLALLMLLAMPQRPALIPLQDIAAITCLPEAILSCQSLAMAVLSDRL
jgi:hypothetical protein